MENSGWATTIRTGDPRQDQVLVEQHHRAAQARGLHFRADPRPDGGFQVSAFFAPMTASHASHGTLPECQACGRQAQLKHVGFTQNIGVVFMRFPKTIRGYLCRFCIDAYFWEYTAITLFFGWWGVISFFYSLYAIPANVIEFLSARKMTPPPEDFTSVAWKKTAGICLLVFATPIGLLALGTLFAAPTLSLIALAGAVFAVVSGLGYLAKARAAGRA